MTKDRSCWVAFDEYWAKLAGKTPQSTIVLYEPIREAFEAGYRTGYSKGMTDATRRESKDE